MSSNVETRLYSTTSELSGVYNWWHETLKPSRIWPLLWISSTYRVSLTSYSRRALSVSRGEALLPYSTVYLPTAWSNVWTQLSSRTKKKKNLKKKHEMTSNSSFRNDEFEPETRVVSIISSAAFIHYTNVITPQVYVFFILIIIIIFEQWISPYFPVLIPQQC